MGLFAIIYVVTICGRIDYDHPITSVLIVFYGCVNRLPAWSLSHFRTQVLFADLV